MSHILVKWLTEEKWDVYPITRLLDQKVAASIARKPASVCGYTGKAFDVQWDPSEEPSPAFLVAAGDHKKMEKLRAELAQHSSTGGQQSESAASATSHAERTTDCCKHKAEVKQLRKNVKELESELCEAENRCDAAKMVKRLEKLIDKLQGRTDVTPNEEDIGNGVLVNKAVLDRLKNSFGCNPCRFARNLASMLFTTEELRGHSLYGSAPNIKKGSAAKPGLDRKRLDAILDYASSKFGVPVGPLKKSLASMMLELKDD
ncbi:uncharacterized protein LOC135372680 [Ornithodoros turicata]|uniref:uncharacterized protein LOC135372680 n=1 Tax=Ornithodoros turicata TaxID=34597 RepID=UPI0031388874